MNIYRVIYITWHLISCLYHLERSTTHIASRNLFVQISHVNYNSICWIILQNFVTIFPYTIYRFSVYFFMLLVSLILFYTYRIGEVFVHLTSEETQSKLERAKEDIAREVEALDTKTEEFKQILSDLKVQLYAKFGNNINLEADDDS